MESAYIETVSKSDKNTIIGYIGLCKHPNLTMQNLMDTFLEHLFDKPSYENKNIIILGDFNIDLPHY